MNNRTERRSRGSAPNVLIVDDEADIRELLDITLSRMGLMADLAGTVEEARAFLEQKSYRLCLTDMRLPDGDGLDLVRYIAENIRDLPVAVITAYGSMENAVQVLKAGAFDYIAKPISLEQLRALVKSVYNLQHSPPMPWRRRETGEQTGTDLRKDSLQVTSGPLAHAIARPRGTLATMRANTPEIRTMTKRAATIEESELHLFANTGEWHAWLTKNHARNSGVWLRIGKKNSGLVTLTYDEAVETALCHGWIDAIRKSYDAVSFVQHFSPRKARSIWSQINRERVLALLEAGVVMPAGLAAMEVAKANGEWDRAYSPGSTITEPKDLLAALRKNPRAKAFYATLNAQNRFAILHRLGRPRTLRTVSQQLCT